MVRRIGGFLSILSAILCAGVIVLGGRSQRVVDLVLVQTPGHHAAGIAADRGRIVLAITDLSFTSFVSTQGVEQWIARFTLTPDEFADIREALFEPTPAVKFSRLGLMISTGTVSITPSSPVRFNAVAIPCWLMAAALAIPPSLFARRVWISRRRKRLGQCPRCGYDLRASGERCPECGRVTTPP